MVYSGCWTGIALVAGGILVAVLLVAAARRLFSAADLQDGHESTSTLLTIVGTLYAVLLGLVVVDAMARFDKACEDVQTESNCLADIFQLANRIPDPYRQGIRGLCRTYAQQVVELEWPAMARAQMNLEARMTALDLAKALDGFEPTTEAEKIVYPAILEQIRLMWDRRRDRAGAAEYGIPAVEWAVLIMGAVVTIFLGGLLHVDSRRLHLVATALTALVIGLNLYLVCLFGYPFAGELSVSDRPFRVDIGIFDGVYDRIPAHGGETRGPPSPAVP
jgi:hypothetical protein